MACQKLKPLNLNQLNSVLGDMLRNRARYDLATILMIIKALIGKTR